MAIRGIGACWKAKSGNGYNCVLDEDVAKGERFSIFKNKSKKEDKHPDLNIVVFEDDEEGSTPIPEDDIPF